METEGNLSDFERDMSLVPDGLVSGFQKLLIYWNFPTKPALVFTENSKEKRKYPASSLGKNALLMPENTIARLV